MPLNGVKMALVIYTVRQLVSESYYLTNIVARDNEVVSGTQSALGLLLLNTIIDFSRTDKQIIPFWENKSYSTATGVSKYYIKNLSSIENITYLNGSEIIPLRMLNSSEYYDSTLSTNNTGDTGAYYAERLSGGTNIILVNTPASDSTMYIHGKFACIELEFTSNLLDYFELGYIEYLTYKLADSICIRNNIETPVNILKSISDYRAIISSSSVANLTMDNYVEQYYRDDIVYI